MGTDNFTEIPAGTFTMGANDGPHAEDGEHPARPVTLATYQIAKTAVTNEAFAAFVAHTHYRTQAETQGGSLVFKGQLSAPDDHAPTNAAAPWWRWVRGAHWRRPDGATEAPAQWPVVHIAMADAIAFCAWSGARLPTEAEWERAAQPQGEIVPHTWRGRFPDDPATPPFPRAVGDAAPNAFGLRHACGNVWEWTADRFTRLHSPRMTQNPKGPLNGELRVVKGGSFLCCPSYCGRYRPSSRRGETPNASTSHLGFRLARS